MGGSASKSTSESQSSNFVDQTQAPFLADLFGQGQDLASQQLSEGSDFQTGILDPAQQAFQNFLTPQQNPFLQGQIEQGQRGIARNFQENLLPGIGSSATAAGQFGGGRHGVAQGVALRDANQQSSDFAQNLLSQDFQGQQDRAIAALTQAGNIGNLAFQPLQNLTDIIGAPTVLGQSTSESKSDSASGGKSG